MKKALLLLILAIPSCLLYAQTLSKNDPLKFDADYYLMEKDFSKALTTYLNILKSEPENADIQYKVGICYLNSEDEKAKAIDYLEQAVQKISEKYNPNSFKETDAPVDALFLLGSAYRVNNQIDEAMDAYSRYKNYLDPKDEYNNQVVDQYMKSCELARNMQRNPISIVRSNLGGTVNNATANFNAVVSGDGTKLMYTAPGRQGYDIFQTTLEDTAWTTPRNITSTLGAGKYLMTADLSYDGLTLLLTLDDPMNSDILVSRFNKGRWSKAESVGKEINSKYNETHASLSTDSKTLYFTSDRKGGVGDRDIYKSEANTQGIWEKPVNLGPEINTPFNEETPFIAETGDRLYFSSEGHEGIGGYDIFYYNFSNPAAGVVNVGYPLNTTDNDLFYVPTGDGNTAIYAFAGNDGYGGRDIYRVNIEELAVAVGSEEEEEELAVAVGSLEEPEVIETLPEIVVETLPEIVVETLPETAIETLPETVVEIPETVVETLPDTEIETVAEIIPKIVPEPDVREELAGAAEEESAVAVAVGTASYRIQIMALRKPVDLNRFAGLEGVRVAWSDDNWYRYTLGNTSSRIEAENLLSEMISRGYDDAFIKANKVVPEFTIQVMAVPGPLVHPRRLPNLSEVLVTRGTDNFCRYSTGEFATREDALASLEQVKALGYRKAFVTRMK